MDQQPVLKSFLEYAFAEGLVNRHAFEFGLEAILGAEIVSALDIEAKRRIELLCFIEGTRRLRQRVVTRLLPEGLVVYGDDGWASVTPEAQGWIGYEGDLPDHYRQCELNLNITSIQMPNAVNQRVFDCPAAGGFLLTDAQPDLALLFDEETETAQYDSLEGCVDQFRFFRTHPKARIEIINNARRRILNEHTYRHRLLAIEGILRSAFAG
jgi:spore maturation protein CgeB